MFKDNSIEQYNNLLASKAATPGGGSALPLVATYACSLAEMAANVTLSKYGEDYDYAEQLHSAVKLLQMSKNKLYMLADDDSAAFDNIIAAMRLPKETEQQVAWRKAALQKQYHKAALVPLEVMQLCRRALDCVEKAMPYMYKYVASDAVIGASLLKSVIVNSKHNVEANTSLIADDNLRQRLEKEAAFAMQGI